MLVNIGRVRWKDQSDTMRAAIVGSAIAGAVAIVVALIPVIGAMAGNGEQDSAGSLTATAQATGQPLGPSSAGSSDGNRTSGPPGTPPASASAQAEGRIKRTATSVVMPRGTPFDLDTDRPDWGVRDWPSDLHDLYVSADDTLWTRNSATAGYFGRTAPGYPDCVALTAYVDPGRDQMAVGSSLCIVTSEKRYAALTVTDHNRGQQVITLSLTVWKLPNEP